MANVSFVLPGNLFVTIPFDKILNGITVERVILQAEKLKEEGVISEC